MAGCFQDLRRVEVWWADGGVYNLKVCKAMPPTGWTPDGRSNLDIDKPRLEFTPDRETPASGTYSVFTSRLGMFGILRNGHTLTV